ncbi:MAG: methyltransferase domain-containing protein [Sulfuriferula sp.]
MMPPESLNIMQRIKRLFGMDVSANRQDAGSASTSGGHPTTAVSIIDLLTSLRIVEERTRTLETQLNDSLTLLRITEERSRTLQYQASQALFAAHYQIDMLQKWYLESVPATSNLANKPCVVAARSIRLDTAHSIAFTSNDHIAPDSTVEGVVRPTRFVRHCIDILGQDIRCLDLGTGAAGLVFEYVMNGVVAIGVDGSDYCKRNKVGYWPILPDNLCTCDITQPFRFMHADDGSSVKFDVITMWEVLEHIGEKDLSLLLQNVEAHLESTGYCIGSISLVEYVHASGIPYHVTLKPKPWWKEKFLANGLVMLDDHPFNNHLFCRGNGPNFQDFHNYFINPEDGFHFVAQRVASS